MRNIALLLMFNLVASAQNTFPSSGNVGIGTNTPENNLHIDGGSAGSAVKLGNTVTAGRMSSWLATNESGFATLQSWKAGTGGWILSLNPSGGSVGIGTLSPERHFHVDGGTGGTTMMLGNTTSHLRTSLWLNTESTTGKTFIQSWWNGGLTPRVLSLNAAGGTVGIGTSNPQRHFHIDGGVGGTSMMLGNTTSDQRTSLWLNAEGESGKTFIQSWWAGVDPGILSLNPGGGNVGIGTASPDAKLAVKGSIHSQEVKVDMLGAMVPDYVFEKDYNLPSLDSIKTYIDQRKHLPDVPSAKEMEANGVNLGEMNMLLLKKVEELTLYLVKKDNEIKALQNQMEELKSKRQ